MKTQSLDWKKVKAFIAKRKPREVSAGIASDWYWTAATIYRDGKFIRNHRACIVFGTGTPCFEAKLRNGDTVKVQAGRNATKRELARNVEKYRRTMALLKVNIEKMKAETAARKAQLLQEVA